MFSIYLLVIEEKKKYNKYGHVCKEIINIVENSKGSYKKGLKVFSK